MFKVRSSRSRGGLGSREQGTQTVGSQHGFSMSFEPICDFARMPPNESMPLNNPC